MNEITGGFVPEKAAPDKKTAVTRCHIMGENGPSGVYDMGIFQYILETQPMFVIGTTPYIYRNGVYIPDTTGTLLKTMIRDLIVPKFVKSNVIKRVYELFISAAELQREFSRLNNYPAHWINFRNGFYDPVAQRMVPHSPDYLATNQIPHDFYPDREYEGDEIEDWLSHITQDPGEREMLLEYSGYCLTRDMGQQKFLILHGEGGTGKSIFIRMLEAMVGERNISNVPLSELEHRFSAYGLMGKLLNSCGDIEDRVLENTSVIKKALGEDILWADQKHKDAISFKNNAKMVFSTNELPSTVGDRSNGFYRRLLLHRMDKMPAVKKTDYFRSLERQMDYFIKLSVQALSRMYDRGYICESASSAREVKEMKCGSDTVGAWLRERTRKDVSAKSERAECYRDYVSYCRDNSLDMLSNRAFYMAVREKNIAEYKSCGLIFFKGLEIESRNA